MRGRCRDGAGRAQRGDGAGTADGARRRPGNACVVGLGLIEGEARPLAPRAEEAPIIVEPRAGAPVGHARVISHDHDAAPGSVAAHGPEAVQESYAGMSSKTDPCSGFLAKDPLDGDRVCAGFRQCGSDAGVAGGNAWDVPLELRCALDDDLSSFDDVNIEYIFNVSFWRAVPRGPASSCRTIRPPRRNPRPNHL